MENKKNEIFKDLTPIDDVDLTGYREALDYAFNNNKIKNIAITGSYGAGKSSILNSYKRELNESISNRITRDVKFIHVSFLYFNYDDKQKKDNDINDEIKMEKTVLFLNQNKIYNKEDNKNKKNNIIEAVLERKVINHIINQIPFKNISDTRFNVRAVFGFASILKKIVCSLILLISVMNIHYFLKKYRLNIFEQFKLSVINNLGCILFLVCFSCVLFFAFNKSDENIKSSITKFIRKYKLMGVTIGSIIYCVLYIEYFVINKILNFKIDKVGLLNPYILLILSVIYIIIYLSIVIGNLNIRTIFSKFKYKNIELNIKSDECNKECSPFFDMYLNEIIYVFENCGADVIVFEDIDRFPKNVAVVIFERLREINIVLNEKLKNKYKVIKFCYLVRDDIFKKSNNDEEYYSLNNKAKLFDFIIPIVPIMNGFNSYDKFKEYLGEKNIDNRNFEHIFLHITDMRLLKNIANEFNIFNKILNKNNKLNLSCNKLLAIIIYKNLFEEDFNNLNFNKGFLFDILGKSNVKGEVINKYRQLKEQELEKYNNRVKCIQNELNKKYNLEIYDIKGYVFEIVLYKIWLECHQQIFYGSKFFEYAKLIFKRDRYFTSKIIYENRKIINEFIIRENLFELRRNILEYEYIIECIDSDNIYRALHIDSSKFRLVFKEIFDKSLEELGNEGEKYRDILWQITISVNLDKMWDLYLTKPSDENVNEKNFLLNIFSNDNKCGFGYELKDPEYVVSKSNYMDYIHSENILNFGLLNYLLDKVDFSKWSGTEPRMELLCFLQKLSCAQNFEFVIEYFKNNIGMGKNSYNDEFIFVLYFFKFEFENIEKFAKIIKIGKYEKNRELIKNVKYEKIRELIKNGKYEKNRELIKNVKYEKIRELIKNGKYEKIRELIKSGKFAKNRKPVKIRVFTGWRHYYNLFLKICRAGLYGFNEKNLAFILEIKHVEHDPFMYSSICKNKDIDTEIGVLYQKIHDEYENNIYSFLKFYFKNIVSIKDDVEYVEELIGFLFNKEFDDNMMISHTEVEEIFKKYIDLLYTRIVLLKNCDIRKFGDDVRIDMYKYMFKKRVVRYCIENIYDYYLKIGQVDDILINFINVNSQKLDFYNNCSDYNIVDVKSFLNDLKNDERVHPSKKQEIQDCIDKMDEF